MTKPPVSSPSRYGAIPKEEDTLNVQLNHDDNNNGGATPILSRIHRRLPSIEAVEDSLRSIAHANFTLGDEDRMQSLHLVGTATIPSEVANMTKNLIGGGVLSLSGGIALYSNEPKAALSAICWVVILGAVFGYFCLIIGKSCQLTHSATYRECWERTVGTRGGMLVAIVNTLDPLLGIFANASILAQSLQALLEGINVYLSVVECLLLITLIAILPLCLMKNLNALAPFSTLGMAAVLTALGAMTIRYLDGSYLEGGQFYLDLKSKMRPKFGTSNRPFSTNSLPFVCMVYTSFDMHYNSPRFYAELRNANEKRFGQVITYSFGITAMVYFSIAVVGFLTFGENSDSYILNNYSPKDGLATLSRIAIGLCSLVSYPLNFIGVRDNCLDILGIASEVDTDAKLNTFTILLLSILTLTSCFVTDLGLINSVGGGTTVTLVCFVFPALMFREGIRKQDDSRRQSKREVLWVMVLMVVGVVIGIVGVWSSIVDGT